MRFTIWQCTDWCCEDRPRKDRWWNVSVSPGRYESFPTWRDACFATIQDPTGRMWLT